MDWPVSLSENPLSGFILFAVDRWKAAEINSPFNICSLKGSPQCHSLARETFLKYHFFQEMIDQQQLSIAQVSQGLGATSVCQEN